MGAFSTNGAEVRGCACGFHAAGNREKGKAAEGRVLAAGEIKKSSRERGHSRSGNMWTGDRRQWRSGWPYGTFSTFV